MEFPTSVPNQTARNIIHPSRRDNNWGETVNDDLLELASKADLYRDEVRDDVIELERRVAAQFESLVDFINGSAGDYAFQMSSTRRKIVEAIHAYIQIKMSAAIEELIESTKDSLQAIDEMEDTLILQINNIQTEFNLFEGQIISETDRTLAIVDSETRETNSIKNEIVQQVKDIRSKLVSHISDLNDPHETSADKLEGDSVFYQPDPRGTDAIQPHDPFDALSINQPTESELQELAGASVIPIGEVDSATLSTLWQNLLARYVVFDGVELDSLGFYFRFGGAIDVATNEIATLNAIDPSGDILDLDDTTGDPNQIRLTWSATAVNHQPGDFIVLEFVNTNPTEGSTVIIEFYPEGGTLGFPAQTVIETMTRLRFLNVPKIVSSIFSHQAVIEDDPNPEIVIDTAKLNFYDETTAIVADRPVFSFSPDTSLGFDLWKINLSIDSNIETPIVSSFEIPRNILDQLNLIDGLETLDDWPSGYFNGLIGVSHFVGYADPVNANKYIIVSQPDTSGSYYKLIITVASNVSPIVHDEILSVVKETYSELRSNILQTINGQVKTYEPPFVSSSS